jgi:hypothetical protein
MRATAILARWQGGWAWAADDSAPLRIEICQGHAGDDGEVLRKTTAELVTYSLGQTQITVGLAQPYPTDPIPGKDWTVGDEVFVDGAWREVEALACQVDDSTGRVTVVPQFGVVLDEPSERIDRTLGSIGGLSGGTSHLARPVDSTSPPNIRPSQ